MQNRYLVCYDVSEPKRLRRTFEKMHGFGDPVQYSVFVCDLSPVEPVLMEAALTDIINMKEDRVLIVDIGPVHGRGSKSLTTLGMAKVVEGRRPLIV